MPIHPTPTSIEGRSTARRGPLKSQDREEHTATRPIWDVAVHLRALELWLSVQSGKGNVHAPVINHDIFEHTSSTPSPPIAYLPSEHPFDIVAWWRFAVELYANGLQPQVMVTQQSVRISEH